MGKLHNVESYALYLSSDIFLLMMSRRMRREARGRARMGVRRSACSVLMGKHDGKRPLVRLRRRWEDNIKIDF